MKKPTVYLSGPISNIAEGNEPLFRAWQKKLKAMGYTVIVPHDLKPKIDYSLKNRMTAKEFAAYEWRMYMDLCVPLVAKAQVLCALPGWSSSDGALCEVQLAIGLKIPYFNCSEMPAAAKIDLSHDIQYLLITKQIAA